MSAMKRVLVLVIMLLFPAAAAVAQEQQPSPAKAQDSSQAATDRALRSRVFEVKHRDPRQLVEVLMPLGSSARGSVMTSNQEFKTITVRDYPEVIATVEEAIRRLDVPEPARPGMEFHVHILIANNNASQSSAQFPAELENVLKQLRATLNYKNYYLMTSQVIQARDQAARGVSSKGVAELRLSPDTAASKNPIFYEFSLQRLELETPASGATVIQIGDFGFSMKVPLMVGPQDALQYQDIGFHTPVRLREGEKVVVGTTSMEDKGIVVVLTGTVTK